MLVNTVVQKLFISWLSVFISPHIHLYSLCELFYIAHYPNVSNLVSP